MAKKDELAASVSLKKEFAMLQKSNADQAEKLATALGVTEVALYELSFLQLLLDSLVTDILPQFKELTPEATLHGQIDRIGKQVFSFKEIISPEMFDAVEQWKNKISSGDAVVKEATDSLSVQSRPRGIAVSTEPV